jgi:hypothetical protein
MAIFTSNDAVKIGALMGNEIDAAAVYGRVEPLITTQQLRDRYLFGIPLVSMLPDPITGKRQVMSDDLVLDFINRGVNIVEQTAMITIAPTEKVERLPFDMNQYISYGFLRLPQRPISRILELAVRPQADSNTTALVINPSWIDCGQLKKGQINLLPWLAAMTPGSYSQSVGTPLGGSANAYLLSVISGRSWVPNFWSVSAIYGFPQGKVPVFVNEAVGCASAIEILSTLAATNRIANYSVGIDSANQSINSGGTQIYQVRITELKEKLDKTVSRIKSLFGQSIFSGNV